jgi:hypothetical protein
MPEDAPVISIVFIRILHKEIELTIRDFALAHGILKNARARSPGIARAACE